MPIKFELPLRFSAKDFADSGEVKASSLLLAFQNIAVAHAKHEGLGFDDLIKQNLIWVVTKLKFKILHGLRPDTEYTLVTYPRHSSSLVYERDFYILDPDGEELVIATSHWCVLNFETRRVVRSDLDFKGEYTTRLALPEGIERIRPHDLVRAGSHTVTAEDLDENEHTNNCRYADMALSILGITSAREFVINFSHETRLGDEIELFSAPDGIASGMHDGAVVFTAMAR